MHTVSQICVHPHTDSTPARRQQPTDFNTCVPCFRSTKASVMTHSVNLLIALKRCQHRKLTYKIPSRWTNGPHQHGGRSILQRTEPCPFRLCGTKQWCLLRRGFCNAGSQDSLTVSNQGAERPKHTTRHHYIWHFELQIFTNTRNLLAR